MFLRGITRTGYRIRLLWQAGGAGRSRGRTGPGCLNHCGAVGRSSLMGAGTGLRIGMLSGPRKRDVARVPV